MTMPTPRPVALICYLFIVAIVTCSYWAIWFLAPEGHAVLAAEPGSVCHAVFEDAFLAADLWMAFCALVAAILLIARRPQAHGWLLMAGSAGLYLLGMDVLYDVQNGIYQRLSEPTAHDAVLTEIAINAGTLLFALWSLTHGWRRLAK